MPSSSDKIIHIDLRTDSKEFAILVKAYAKDNNISDQDAEQLLRQDEKDGKITFRFPLNAQHFKIFTEMYAAEFGFSFEEAEKRLIYGKKYVSDAIAKNPYFRDKFFRLAEATTPETISSKTPLEKCIWKSNITCPIMVINVKYRKIEEMESLVKNFCKVCPLLKLASAQGRASFAYDAAQSWAKENMPAGSGQVQLTAPKSLLDQLEWFYDPNSAWFVCKVCYDTTNRFFEEKPDEMQQHLKEKHGVYQTVSIEMWERAINEKR